MIAEELIRELKIASPCRARWEDMQGSDQCRFCQHCSKHVYNFAEMTAEDAHELIMEREGKLCGRFYRREDGTLLTADCPVGLHRRVPQLVYAALLLLFACASAVAFGNKDKQIPTRRSQFTQQLDSLMWDVKGFLGLQRPVVLGEIAPTPAPPPAPPKS